MLIIIGKDNNIWSPKNVGLIHPKKLLDPSTFFSFPTSTEQDHENQNILATNGRPRPFYRRTSLTLRQETTEITHQNPKSLVVNVQYLILYIIKKFLLTNA